MQRFVYNKCKTEVTAMYHCQFIIIVTFRIHMVWDMAEANVVSFAWKAMDLPNHSCAIFYTLKHNFIEVLSSSKRIQEKDDMCQESYAKQLKIDQNYFDKLQNVNLAKSSGHAGQLYPIKNHKANTQQVG